MFQTDATSLPRLLACLGSRRLIADIPADSRRAVSPTQDEGNAVHWAIEQICKDGIVPSEHTKAPNGVALTSEMIDHACEYVERVRQPSSAFEIDTTFIGEGWRINGRADHIARDVHANVLQVDDFKYGWRIVEPEHNWTLLFHAASYCLAQRIEPASIIFSIHQPRPFHPDGPVRTWVISYKHLMSCWREIIDKLSSVDDELRTGPQCHLCPALATCPAARRAALNVVDLTELPSSEELDNSELSRELDLLKRAESILKDRINALENLATLRLQEGQVIENYALERGLSNARWKDGVTPEIVLAITGCNVAQSKFVTPAEAKRRGVIPDVLAAFTERVPTALKVVRVDADKRAKRLLKGSK